MRIKFGSKSYVSFEDEEENELVFWFFLTGSNNEFRGGFISGDNQFSVRLSRPFLISV